MGFFSIPELLYTSERKRQVTVSEQSNTVISQQAIASWSYPVDKRSIKGLLFDKNRFPCKTIS